MFTNSPFRLDSRELIVIGVFFKDYTRRLDRCLLDNRYTQCNMNAFVIGSLCPLPILILCTI